MSQRKCLVRCVGRITGYTPVSKSKQEADVPAEVPWKQRACGMPAWWHVYVQRAGIRCDHEDRLVVRKIIKTRENFKRGRKKQEGKELSHKNCTVAPLCVHFSHLSLLLTYISDNKKIDKRSKLYFHTSASLFSSLYTI